MSSTGSGNASQPPVLEGLLPPLAEPLDPKICQKAARYAIRVCAEMSKRSTLLRQEAKVAWLNREEILPHVGLLLGAGGFNNVYELEGITLKGHKCVKTEPLRQALAGKNFKPDKLAIKFLSDTSLRNSQDACNGSADLLMEAKYLTTIAAQHPHPGIIRLHGVSRGLGTGNAAHFGKGERAGLFLVLDRLYDSLDKRIKLWRELQRRKIASNEPGTPMYLKVLFLQQLLVAVDVASALRHLHSLDICFRDLKPDNVGFDFEGRVKIFDFGLAKELDPQQKRSAGAYAMSGGTGSRRYMAPEVALNELYGLSVDVYSLAIVIWETLSLDRAFGTLSSDEFKARVVKGTERPAMAADWSNNLQTVLRESWQRDPNRRPTAETVLQMLKQELQDLVARDFPMQAHAEERKRQLGLAENNQGGTTAGV